MVNLKDMFKKKGYFCTHILGFIKFYKGKSSVVHLYKNESTNVIHYLSVLILVAQLLYNWNMSVYSNKHTHL